MCGIAGIWFKNGAANLLPAIEKMCHAMHQRGPDDEGYVTFDRENYRVFSGDHSMDCKHVHAPFASSHHISKSYDHKSEIAFGFKRLSIIDLSAQAHQPITDSTGRFWLIFNGEVYNFPELKDELISLGHHFISTSDSEVVLKAFMQWGTRCFTRFNGMFAMAIFDRNTGELCLARDRIGIKPLYYSDSDQQLVFASSIKALLSSGLVQAEIDRYGLQQNFMFGISQRPQTAFKNIKALEPGHFVVYNTRNKVSSKQKYWDIPLGSQDFAMSEKSALMQLDEVLNKAVQCRLNADVEVGTFMSGGVDSTLISAMAGHHQKGIKAFTLGVDSKYGDVNEIEEAAANAELNELEHIIGMAKPEVVLEHLTAVVEGYEEPYHHLPVNFLISKLVHENGLKVVLNGLGGDELFGGYDAYAKLHRWERIKMLPKVGKMLPDGLHEKADKLKKFSGINRIDEYYAHYYTTFEQDQLKALFGKGEGDVSQSIHDTYNSDDRDFSDDVEALNYFNLRSYIGSHHVRTIDQFTMHHSIEGRFPMLDHEFVELAFRIPTRLKLHNGKQKYILRKLAKRYVAPECLSMKKRGFSLPLGQMLDNELSSTVGQCVQQLKERQFLDSDAIDNIMQKGTAAQIWHLTMTELWLQNYIDRKWV